ncbi:MAG: 30S ribosomal protein S12 methylthiotransferase RimO [Longimicrobiales bacterium]
MTDTATRRRRALPVLPAVAPLEPVPAVAPDAPRIGILTLGCDKNTVDTERLMARLAAAGARVTDDAGDADVLVVNTCGFIEVAKEESIETILEAARLKADGRVRAVVAMGCLVQRYKAELAAGMPEVDLFLGLTEAERLVPELRRRGLLPPADASTPLMERPLRRIATRTRHTSYLKVSEGCDHTCAFCAIPLMRGKHRSTPIDALVREARELEAQGVVELNVVSQDTTWYGRDLARGMAPAEGDLFVGAAFRGMAGIDEVSPPKRANGDRSASRQGLLPELLEALLDATAIPWIRLFYMYPSGITRALVDRIAAEPRIVRYLDMPIQHGSDTMLARMRRPERRRTIRERVAWLRAAIPGIALRTTVIVGFPGETDEEFEELIELLEELRFDQVGAFSYSHEENTRAATMPDPVAPALARERLERLLDVQRSIKLVLNEERIGKEDVALIDEVVGRENGMDAKDARGAVARSASQALEVDGVVHIEDAGEARPGDFVRIRITGALEDDLVAERIA